MSELTPWAERVARQHLEGLGLRWSHTLGVVEQASALSPILPWSEIDVLVAAAYLHDIGYAPALEATGFHPLDGARYLRALGHERLATLVAFHTGARAEAEERGLERELAEFREEDSLVARALTYCDLVTASDGKRVELSVRLGEVARRYDPDTPVARAAHCSSGEFRTVVGEFDNLLARVAEAAGPRTSSVPPQARTQPGIRSRPRRCHPT